MATALLSIHSSYCTTAATLAPIGVKVATAIATAPILLQGSQYSLVLSQPHCHGDNDDDHDQLSANNNDLGHLPSAILL